LSLRRSAVLGALCALVTLVAGALPAYAVSPGLVISQVYGGGGNTGAPLTHDYVEIYNRGPVALPLGDLSIQYASATGTGDLGANATQLTELPDVTLQPGQYFLIQEAAGAGNGVALTGPDVVDPTPIAMAAGAGKVALVSGDATLDCNGSSTNACDAAALARIIDLIGYGNANFFEGAPAPTLNNTTAAIRASGGQQDTDNNAADFAAATPNPRNSNPGDAAPSVSSSIPVPGASGVARDANVSITFSEPVNTADGWYTIDCATSGAHPASAVGDGTTFTLDPATNFAANESCTVAVLAANVTDQDTNDPPDTMAANHSFTFQTVDLAVCGDPATLIHEIQGTTSSSSRVGQAATIEGVVVGDYQQAFNGFYVQEDDAQVDDDPATSEGIFVFQGGVDVEAGDNVRVTGTVNESFNVTQLSSVSAVVVCPGNGTVTPAGISLPVEAISDHERVEGMLVSFDQTLTATEVFNLGRFGEVSLSGVGRLYNPTAVTTPGPSAQAKLAENNRSRIILDDANNQQNIDPTIHPQGGLSASNTLRVGDTLDGLTGVMDFRFSAYRIQPVGPLAFASSNPRPATPAPVGGTLKVASFNVLNYFNGDGLGGGFPTSRGASDADELQRQQDKIVSALQVIDADVVGLMEIENDGGPNSAIAQLVDALNDVMGDGTYSYVDTGVIGTDEIKVALIYKPASVAPVGDWRIITSAVDPRFDDTRSRPSLAQTFLDLGSGQKATVLVNHLKSKGSACAGDPDTGDGSGNCNVTRTLAAEALVDWLATDPTGSGDDDFLIIGDLNSYTFETPITTLEDGGFTNLVRRFGGLTAYSYVFMGESGYLDHALASESLNGQVSGTTEWHINPDEPTVLDYLFDFKTTNQHTTFYAPGPYRSSDHDPVIVGLEFEVTHASLETLTRTFVADAELADALSTKLQTAAAAAARGNTQAEAGAMRAFANQVRAQAGKKITAEDAATLLELASTL
jgi:predicted extracellular nuclease